MTALQKPAEWALLKPEWGALYEYAPEWSPWLHARGPSLCAVVDTVVAQALNAEAHLPKFKRTRARRAADLAIFTNTVNSLVAHVSYEHLRGAGPVSLSLDKSRLARRSRYLSPLQSKQLPKIIKLLGSPDLGFLTVIPGTKATGRSEGRLTRISAGPRLVSRLAGVNLDDVARKPGEEVVLLKSDRDDLTGLANLVEYADDEFTAKARAEVRRINVHLAASDVQYMGESVLFDERKCHLVRRFTRGRWGCGGRLWGGFWDSPMDKAQRLSKILISGEPVVSVDFSSMILRVAYAYVGVLPPDGDLYEAITFKGTNGAPKVIPRGDVKKIVAARLNGAKDWPEELRMHRAGLPWSAVVTSLKQAHPALAGVFDSDMGQVLAFTESEILVSALLRLVDEDITALPLHDCVLVAESDEAAAVAAMLDSFQFHARQPGRVSIERTPKETK